MIASSHVIVDRERGEERARGGFEGRRASLRGRTLSLSKKKIVVSSHWREGEIHRVLGQSSESFKEKKRSLLGGENLGSSLASKTIERTRLSMSSSRSSGTRGGHCVSWSMCRVVRDCGTFEGIKEPPEREPRRLFDGVVDVQATFPDQSRLKRIRVGEQRREHRHDRETLG